MKNNFLVIIQKEEDINKLKGLNIDKFLYPLKFFSVGFNKYFDINEIKEENSYLYLNKMMTNDDLDRLNLLLKKLPSNIKGVVFDDLGIVNLLKDINIERILFPMHLNLNNLSVKEMLKFVDTIVISPDITIKETNEILASATKKLCIYAYGYLNVAYSKRLLNSNYSKYHNIRNKNLLHLKNTDFDFISVENEDGTVFYYDKVFNGLNEKYEDNIKYKIVNLFNIDVNDFLENNSDYKGFLDKETIYKLKGGE